jgi:hypothetical protein
LKLPLYRKSSSFSVMRVAVESSLLDAHIDGVWRMYRHIREAAIATAHRLSMIGTPASVATGYKPLPFPLRCDQNATHAQP